MTQTYPPDPHSQPPDRPGRRFNTVINVQTLIAAVLGAAVSLTINYYGLVGRVSLLEERDRQQEIHFDRVERLINEQRSDTREALRGISQDVKDLNLKLDAWKDQMNFNSAGNRPEIRKWSK